MPQEAPFPSYRLPDLGQGSLDPGHRVSVYFSDILSGSATSDLYYCVMPCACKINLLLKDQEKFH